jgi:hypothetical protein
MVRGMAEGMVVRMWGGKAKEVVSLFPPVGHHGTWTSDGSIAALGNIHPRVAPEMLQRLKHSVWQTYIGTAPYFIGDRWGD